MLTNPVATFGVTSGPRQVDHSYFTYSVYKIVLQESIPAQIRQLILYIINDERICTGIDFCKTSS